jgi:DNA-binding NtrC family response regulator
MQRFSRKHGVKVRDISDECLSALVAHNWPGNVRELQNVVERAVILSGDTGFLEMEHLGFTPSSTPTPALPGSAPAAPAPGVAAPLPAAADHELTSLAEMEKRHILAALGKTADNRTHAAKLLGISVRTLRNKLNEYGVHGKGESAAPEEAD